MLDGSKLYKIGSGDADVIDKRRSDFDAYRAKHARHTTPEPGDPAATGHVGNTVRAGDEYPAMVVRDWNSAADTVNLKVLLDGDDTHWATSGIQGDEPGQWHWPPRVEREPGDRPARF